MSSAILWVCQISGRPTKPIDWIHEVNNWSTESTPISTYAPWLQTHRKTIFHVVRVLRGKGHLLKVFNVLVCIGAEHPENLNWFWPSTNKLKLGELFLIKLHSKIRWPLALKDINTFFKNSLVHSQQNVGRRWPRLVKSRLVRSTPCQ